MHHCRLASLSITTFLLGHSPNSLLIKSSLEYHATKPQRSASPSLDSYQSSIYCVPLRKSQQLGLQQMRRIPKMLFDIQSAGNTMQYKVSISVLDVRCAEGKLCVRSLCSSTSPSHLRDTLLISRKSRSQTRTPQLSTQGGLPINPQLEHRHTQTLRLVLIDFQCRGGLLADPPEIGVKDKEIESLPRQLRQKEAKVRGLQSLVESEEVEDLQEQPMRMSVGGLSLIKYM